MSANVREKRRVALPEFGITIPKLARLIKVSTNKLHSLIESGDLQAVNLAVQAGGRPRWRIFQADLDEFLALRATNRPLPKPARRKRAVATTKYY